MVLLWLAPTQIQHLLLNGKPLRIPEQSALGATEGVSCAF